MGRDGAQGNMATVDMVRFHHAKVMFTALLTGDEVRVINVMKLNGGDDGGNVNSGGSGRVMREWYGCLVLVVVVVVTKVKMVVVKKVVMMVVL